MDHAGSAEQDCQVEAILPDKATSTAGTSPRVPARRVPPGALRIRRGGEDPEPSRSAEKSC